MEAVFILAVIFLGTYLILKNFNEFLLKRKLIKSGHFEKAEILEQKGLGLGSEDSKYTSLKWGVIALFSGIGLIVIDQMGSGRDYDNFMNGVLPLGIELVFISVGFLVYFFIANYMKKK